MAKNLCQFCKWELAQKHKPGCPKKEEDLKAWARGYNDAVAGMNQAEPGSASYILGHNRGKEDIEECDAESEMCHANIDDPFWPDSSF